MPSSSAQETNSSIASSDQKSAKVTQKSSSDQTPSKGKKNGKAKDVGGVMAAVRKEGKLNNASKTTDQSTPDKSPEKSPELPSVEPAPSSTIPAASPLLDALSSAKFARHPSSTVHDGTKNGTGYSSSPSNLISFGESPDTQPSSYEERVPHFNADTKAQRGIMNGYHPQSASPPASHRRRPLSYTPLSGHNFSTHDARTQMSPPSGNRRASMYSPPNRYSPHPPPPHQPQAHFYGAPELNFLPPAQGSALQPGAGGYYCGFDKLPSAHSGLNENVILTGYGSGLRVHVVSKRGTNQVFDIKNLRGGVFDAKILPWTTSDPHGDGAPLVAVVVHGVAQRDTFAQDEHLSSEENSLAVGELPRSPRLLALDQEYDDEDYYQTTVEIYSVSSRQHIGTLLVLPKRPLVVPLGSPLYDPPAPDGALSIRADGGYVVVSSGVSGEVWVFKHQSIHDFWQFSCVGKVWTTLQHNPTVESTQPSEKRQLDSGATLSKLQNVPILSHKGRFLAFCPPALSSQVTLGAETAPTAGNNRTPGINSRAPPQLPTVNCQVETPGDESLVKQILQVGTQKFIEGATYLGGQGMQAWNNYWNKPASGQSPPDSLSSQAQNTVAPFPPTHGTASPVAIASKDPGLLSILDLATLTAKTAHSGLSIHPLTTFRVPHGCSFISFAPSGLALFTASSKGDTQFIWDLMRMQYFKSSFLKDASANVAPQSQHVRQIAKFSRMTIARIVDVVWASPHGERAAMVTEPGTVHILDLPASAFNWPPPPRKMTVVKGEEEAVDLSTNAKSIVSNAGTAVSSVFAAAPFGRRRRSTAGTSALTVAQAGQTTQAFAAGISRSVGAATGRMNELRKSGTTKLHLPASSMTPSHSCLTFVSGAKKDSVMLTGNGIVRIYSIKTRRADRPADKQKAAKGAKFIEFRLPALPIPQKRPLSMQQMEDLQLTEGDFEPSYNPALAEPLKIQSCRGTESTIAQAELESNAPFQPFHTDHRRISLYVYSGSNISHSSTSPSALITPLQIASPSPKTKSYSPAINTKLLAFGLPISATRVDTGVGQVGDDDLTTSRGAPSSVIERITREDGEEIVITTRRRKGANRSDVDEAAEGGDDVEWSILDVARQQV